MNVSGGARDLIRRTWTTEALASEPAFRAAMTSASQSILECRRRKDIAGANDWLACITAVRAKAVEEPFASIYAHFLGYVSSVMADWLVCEHRLADALGVLTHAWETLDARDGRRASCGLPFLPSLPSRWRLLGVLCDIKWRVPYGQYRNVIMTPAEHLRTWQNHVIARRQQFRADTAAAPSAEDRATIRANAKQSFESLLWCGVWVASCGFRYCRHQLPGLLSEYNHLYSEFYGSAALALEERQWLSGPPLAEASPMYWQFEIIKLWLGAQRAKSASPSTREELTAREFHELYARLWRCAERWTVGREDHQYLEGLRHDYQWMRTSMPFRPELDRERQSAASKAASY